MAFKIVRRLCIHLLFVVAWSINPNLQWVTPALSASSDLAQALAERFSSVKSMSGRFVQTGPRGEKSTGKFFLQRPGRIRFDYAGQQGVSVIADGKSLVIYNRKLKTSRLYPLSKTPLKLLLADKLDLSGSRLKSVEEVGDVVVIKLADKAAFGASNISITFDRKTFDLRKWKITDEKRLTTTVDIFNVKQGARAAAGTFIIDYSANRELNTTKSR